MVLVNNNGEYGKFYRTTKGGLRFSKTPFRDKATEVNTAEVFDILEWLNSVNEDSQWRATD